MGKEFDYFLNSAKKWVSTADFDFNLLCYLGVVREMWNKIWLIYAEFFSKVTYMLEVTQDGEILVTL